MQHRNMQGPDNPGVQRDGQNSLQPDERLVFPVVGLQKSPRGSVETPETLAVEKRRAQHGDISGGHEQPVKAGEDSVHHGEFPDAIIVFEIEIERFVVRAVAHVMAEAPGVAGEMARGRTTP
jgi:hypothetical protein